jgi:Cof subfamily protein (haloacid dehalogenase superfamily)
MCMNNIRLVATDLDGTFLRNDKTISPANLDTLEHLGSNGIIRVAATGRNMLKVKDVIPDHVPFDYIVYSSGAGIFNWHENRHIYTKSISAASADHLISYFISEDVNFHAFHPAPENHLHWYHRGSEPCEEFERYHLHHQMHARPLPDSGKLNSELCQFLVVIPGDEEKFYRMKNQIEALCPEIRVIRATSPLNTGYIWMEIFHKSVSKGNGVLYLCNLLDIDPKNTLGIGNDYNDIDLLEVTAYSFLTDNAPDELKKSFRLVPANEEDAFALVVSKIFNT